MGEKPGSTYYLQKVSHDILGIVDHSENKSTVYVFDERIGPKNTDHTVSFLTNFWHSVTQRHPWIHRLANFLDNATSTNKNKYLFSWAMEMVSTGELEHIHISFMIAGHTKFAPDRLFSTIGCAYKTEDVFTISDLKSICDKCATCTVETGENVLTWRNTLGEKYSDLPGVRKYHDFLIVKAHDRRVVMKVHVRDSSKPGVPTTTYKETQTKSLTAEKWQTWLLCTIALYHVIAGQTICHLSVQLHPLQLESHQLLLLLLHLVRLVRESRVSAPQTVAMVLDTIILPNGL